ncbi:hypothetical protein CHS0354_007256 [Potamilus streckersoni]|uniref:BTB domain-containing protein n=1 Tax=Potamilus streckersoni TaxID=2493646 RepID=A0AAE0WC87_9BIVA|nr:hypothetical protein CHS0354_007256 [Potamilus streckersoni]
MVEQAHFSKLLKALQRLWEEQLLLDITLKTADDQNVRIHKLILFLFSKHFQMQFQAMSTEEINVDVNLSDVKSLLYFLYNGDASKLDMKVLPQLLRKLKLDLLLDDKRGKERKGKKKQDRSFVELEEMYLRYLTFEVELKMLYNTRYCWDVTLMVEGKTFKCHKVILSALSSYFELMFSSGMRESQDIVICLQGVESAIFASVLCYIYIGVITITVANAQQLLSTAVYLQIISLQEQCETFLSRHIDVINCLDMWNLGRTYHCPRLTRDSWEVIIDNFNQIDQSKLISLEKEDFLSLITDDNLNTDSEELVCRLGLKWLEKEPSRDKHSVDIVKAFRFPFLKLAFITGILQSHAVIKKSNDCMETVSKSLEDASESHLQHSTSLSPRKEKGFMVLKSSSYGKGIEIGFYSLGQGKWFALTPLKSRYTGCNFATCLSGTKLFISGGTHKPKACLYFDIENNTWLNMPLLQRGRSGHNMVVVQNCLYVLGGTAGVTVRTEDDTLNVEKLFVCEEGTNWESSSKLMINVSDSACGVIKQNIYLLGGTINNQPGVYSKDVQCFNTETKTCCILLRHLHMPTSLAVATSTFLDIYMISPRGEIIQFRENNVPSVVGKMHNSSMIGYGVLYHEDSVFLFGGSSNTVESDTVYKYDLKTNMCTQQKQLKLPFRKESNQLFASVAHVSRLFLTRLLSTTEDKKLKTPR